MRYFTILLLIICLGATEGVSQWTPPPTPRPTRTRVPPTATPRPPTPLPTRTAAPVSTPTPPPTPIVIVTPTRTPSPTPTPVITPGTTQIYLSAFEYSGWLTVTNAKVNDVVYIEVTSPNGTIGSSQRVTLTSPNYVSAVHISKFAPNSIVKVYINSILNYQLTLP